MRRKYGPQFRAACKEFGVKQKFFRHYAAVRDKCLELGIKSVVDIGFGFGIQAYLFTESGIQYIGIEEDMIGCFFEKEIGEAGDTLIIREKHWPCELPDKPEACISLYSIGSRYGDVEDLDEQIRKIQEFDVVFMDTFEEIVNKVADGYIIAERLKTLDQANQPLLMKNRIEGGKEWSENFC